jgi:hypothetical protein
MILAFGVRGGVLVGGILKKWDFWMCRESGK